MQSVLHLDICFYFKDVSSLITFGECLYNFFKYKLADSKHQTGSSQQDSSRPPSLDDYITPQEDDTVDKYPPLPQVINYLDRL